MPILWRYLLKDYLRIFFLCIIAFVCILLVMRSQEIARFAIISPNPWLVVLFTLYQIPSILPFAVPISGVIASMVLIQSLSNTQELTALRACGCHLSMIYTPLIFSALFFSLMNFLIISELAPRCKFNTTMLLYNTVSNNPLILFKKNKFIKVRNSYVDIKLADNEKEASNLLFVFLDDSSQKLSLVHADQLNLENSLLKGFNLSMVSGLNTPNSFDDLIVENEDEMSIDAASLSNMLQRSEKSLHDDQLPTRACLLKWNNAPLKNTATLFELYKRLFFTILPFTFTILGCSFGLKIGRGSDKTSIQYVLFLSVFIFVCYLLGKSLHKHPSTVLLLYLFPHCAVLSLCLVFLKRRERGIE